MLANRSTSSRSTADCALWSAVMAASNALYPSASSSALKTVSAVSPWRTALQRDTCFPASVFGPVLLSALRRLASICRYEIIVSQLPNWLRFVVLTRLDQLQLGSGCVLSQKTRAAALGSIPILFHHAASSPQRWTSRWCPRQSGTVN